MSRSSQPVTFEPTGDPRVPYRASVGAERWTVRLNDFPEEPSLYTLLVDGVAVEDLVQWPATWTRPGEREDPVERAEYEREADHAQRTAGVRPSKRVR